MGFVGNNAPVSNPSESFTLNTIYNKSLKGKIQFGDLPPDVLCVVFSDGRACAKPLERLLERWYPELEYVDNIGHDFVHKYTGKLFEAKSFTTNGLVFAPSNMTGKGRSIDVEELHRAASQLTYVFCDITSFPDIRIVFKNGVELIKRYPNGKIPFKDKPLFFGC